MPALTLVSSPTVPNPRDTFRGVNAQRRRQRLIDNCISTLMLTLLFSSAIYAVSQLFTLAS